MCVRELWRFDRYKVNRSVKRTLAHMPAVWNRTVVARFKANRLRVGFKQSDELFAKHTQLKGPDEPHRRLFKLSDFITWRTLQQTVMSKRRCSTRPLSAFYLFFRQFKDAYLRPNDLLTISLQENFLRKELLPGKAVEAVCITLPVTRLL